MGSPMGSRARVDGSFRRIRGPRPAILVRPIALSPSPIVIPPVAISVALVNQTLIQAYVSDVVDLAPSSSSRHAADAYTAAQDRPQQIRHVDAPLTFQRQR